MIRRKSTTRESSAPPGDKGIRAVSEQMSGAERDFVAEESPIDDQISPYSSSSEFCSGVAVNSSLKKGRVASRGP